MYAKMDPWPWYCFLSTFFICNVLRTLQQWHVSLRLPAIQLGHSWQSVCGPETHSIDVTLVCTNVSIQWVTWSTIRICLIDCHSWTVANGTPVQYTYLDTKLPKYVINFSIVFFEVAKHKGKYIWEQTQWQRMTSKIVLMHMKERYGQIHG